MAEDKKYWKGIEELEQNAQFVENSSKEFSEQLPVDEFIGKGSVQDSQTHRRDFLKFLGFSVTAATIAACETPVTKSIPFLNKPVDLTPGIANYYASTYFDGIDFAAVKVKTREGRPIFISGSDVSKRYGGVNARINSSVLSLYDSKRAKGPAKKIANSWAKNINGASLDKEIVKKLNSVASKGGNIALVSNTIASPTSLDVIKQFTAEYNAKGASVSHVQYDSISASGILDANEKSFQKRVLPTYNFDEAKTVVSFGADFLGSWLDSVSYTKAFSSRRRPEADWMNKHYQFETTLSVTGANADVRGALKPSQVGTAVLYLYNKLSGAKATGLVGPMAAKLDKAAEDLLASKGSSLVVSGSNNWGVQSLVNAINELLGNYGRTIDLDKEVYTRKGSDKAFNALSTKMAAGKVDAVVVFGLNPSYVAPSSSKWSEGWKSVAEKGGAIYLGDRLDETGENGNFLYPDHHYLEAWNDYEPSKGEYTLAQPTINKLFKTRQWQETLLNWSGDTSEYADFLKKNWQSKIVSGGAQAWTDALHDGVYSSKGASATSDEHGHDSETSATSSAASIVETAKKTIAVKSGEWEVEFYVKTGLGNGAQALNPWLHELPDPISKMTYDNYISMNPADAMKLFGKEDTKDARRAELYIGEQSPAKVATITINGVALDLPVVPQPGQAAGSVGIAVGYGKKGTEAFTREEWLGDLFNSEDNSANTIGKNVFPLFVENGGYLNTVSSKVSIALTDKLYPMATTQTHHTMMGRKLVNETSLSEFKSQRGKAKERGGYNEQLLISDAYGDKKTPGELDLWAEHAVNQGHRWGLSIDLSSCIGCGSCVTSCHLENNVPPVGKDEIRRSRDMHWMRIDRYYSSNDEKGGEFYEMDELNSIQDYLNAEVSEDQPQVAYQPLMCQHCNHAPCETVCPVAATTHSDEGMNQMAYNRCVGTRYCANNCPYKVRRFNWFEYDKLNIPAFPDFAKLNPAQDDLGRMVLNPDVVVRSRGVMEKCSMCVQSIQAGKLEAKKAGEPVQNGAIQTACSSACPTNAITFGDFNDETHDAHNEMQSERAYVLMEEVGTQPNIFYQTKVRNV